MPMPLPLLAVLAAELTATEIIALATAGVVLMKTAWEAESARRAARKAAKED